MEIIKAHLTKKSGTIRLTLPKQIREKLEIKDGDYFTVTCGKTNNIIYKKMRLEI